MFWDEPINAIVLDSSLPAQLDHGTSKAAVSNGRAGRQSCLLQLVLIIIIQNSLLRSGETDMPRLGRLLFLRPCGHPVRRERHEQRPHNAELDTAEKLCFPALWQNWQMSARSLTGIILEPN